MLNLWVELLLVAAIAILPDAHSSIAWLVRVARGRPRPHQALDDRTPDEAYCAMNEMRQAA